VEIWGLPYNILIFGSWQLEEGGDLGDLGDLGGRCKILHRHKGYIVVAEGDEIIVWDVER